MKVLVLYFAIVLCVKSQTTSMEHEGYPAGFLSDCPDSTKPLQISKKALNHVSLIVQGPGDVATATQRKYSYRRMKELSKDPDLDFSKPTFLYVAGYLIDQPIFPPERYLGSLYKNSGYNVLLVELTRYTTTFLPRSVRYMKSLASYVAEMLVYLVKEGLDPKRLEIVGLSLGAQTMSFIANTYKNLTGTNLPVLVGLDPCGPCYRHLGPEDRLDPSDADFVNVIHTNIDGYGMATPMGHVDFYVNGGEYQPSDMWWVSCQHLCSHLRAFWIWLASVRFPKSFIAMQCDSIQQARNRQCFDRVPMVTNILGPRTNKSKQGLFYLSTSHTYPFYLERKGLKKKYDHFSILLNASREYANQDFE